MRASQRRRLTALAATAAAAFVLTLGLSVAPAAADDGNSGTVDTSAQTLVSSQDTKDDQCTGDRCKKIKWCDQKDASLSDDAPVVLLGDNDETPLCVKKPVISYKCCVADEKGTANIHIKIANPNPFKMRVKVWVDTGTPVIHWINGTSSETFAFNGVNNGVHVIHAAVWAGDNIWCKFGDKRVEVTCASPSPSASPSGSPSPSPSVSVSDTANPPGDQLPTTGSSIPTITSLGTAAVAAGGVLFFLGRRRRDLENQEATVIE